MASILVIDDDPAVRMTARLLLERAGHQVAVASDGRSGLAMLARDGADLLIVDIFMPGMDGIETIQEVRKHRADLPIIVMSGTSVGGASAPDFLAMAVKLGAVRSISKPFRPRDIVVAVEQCLADPAPPRSGAA